MKIYHFGLKELQGCADLSDVARLLGVQPKFLSKQIYHTPDAVKYYTFTIPKKDGSAREIHSPNPQLKFIQSRLSRLLYQCYFDLHGTAKQPSSAISHGFQSKRGLSIFTNASRHTNRRFVFNVDLKAFFPSINFGRVRGYFINNKNFALNSTVATVVAQTVCFQNLLPQGAPTSPIISELIAQILDHRLQSLAKQNRCTYSRYADDITYSTNLKGFPDTIGKIQSGLKEWAAGKDLTHAILKSGFEINLSKVRMQQASQRQATTGLTVNEKVNVAKYYYKGVRFCAYAMMTTGKAIAPNRSVKPSKPLTPNQILGMIAHVHDIKGRELEHKALRHYGGLNPAPHYLRLMGDFYHYHRIHISKKPIVICEGKTDYTYIKEAIRWNIHDPRISSTLVNPTLIKNPKGKGDHWLVDFLKHSKSANNLLGLSGGGGDLKNFLNTHLQRISKFHENALQHPVIIIVDNDSQSTGMWSAIHEVTKSKTKIDGSAPFYHVKENLYVVPIPSGGKSDFYIEKLFPAKWLKEKIGTREFKISQKKNEKLNENEYGKGEFAEKVIRANRGNVDCSAFLPLLHTLCDIINRP